MRSIPNPFTIATRVRDYAAANGFRLVLRSIGNISRSYVKSASTFRCRDRDYPYFYHWYNFTWANERAVEIPLIWPMVEKCQKERKRILEVGNVLSHYYPVTHDIVDKYEKSKNVLNIDALTYRSKKQYDLIISISTIEHIGWDETPRNKMKVGKTMRHLAALLEKGGKMIVTFPLGLNPYLDRDFKNGKIRFDQLVCFQRTSADNSWREVKRTVIVEAKYNEPFFAANALVVGVIKKKRA